MRSTIDSSISAFGAAAKAKLANLGASGGPEDQLRAPFEQLLADLAELCGFPTTAVAAIGEYSVSDLKTRPDYAVTVHNALVGFIELKAPGKGADPRKFKDPHDKAQWEKLHSLPNLLFTDGNAFSLWQYGERVDGVRLYQHLVGAGVTRLASTSKPCFSGSLTISERGVHAASAPGCKTRLKRAEAALPARFVNQPDMPGPIIAPYIVSYRGESASCRHAHR